MKFSSLSSLVHGRHCQTSIVPLPNPASQVFKFPTGMKNIAIDIVTFDTRVIPSWDPFNIGLSVCVCVCIYLMSGRIT